MATKTPVPTQDVMAHVYKSVENIDNRILQANADKLPTIAENHLRAAARSASMAPHINLGTFLRHVEHFMLHLQRRMTNRGLSSSETDFVIDGIFTLCSPLIPNMPRMTMKNAPDTYHQWLDVIVATMHECAKSAGFFFYYLVVAVVVPEAFWYSPRIERPR
jgi:hypothetical protein